MFSYQPYDNLTLTEILQAPQIKRQASHISLDHLCGNLTVKSFEKKKNSTVKIISKGCDNRMFLVSGRMKQSQLKFYQLLKNLLT